MFPFNPTREPFIAVAPISMPIATVSVCMDLVSLTIVLNYTHIEPQRNREATRSRSVRARQGSRSRRRFETGWAGILRSGNGPAGEATTHPDRRHSESSGAVRGPNLVWWSGVSFWQRPLAHDV